MKRQAVIRLPEISPPRKQHSPRAAETQELEGRGGGGGQDIAQTLPMDPQDPCSLCFQTGLTPTPVTVDLITKPEGHLSRLYFPAPCSSSRSHEDMLSAFWVPAPPAFTLASSACLPFSFSFPPPVKRPSPQLWAPCGLSLSLLRSTLTYPKKTPNSTCTAACFLSRYHPVLQAPCWVFLLGCTSDLTDVCKRGSSSCLSYVSTFLSARLPLSCVFWITFGVRVLSSLLLKYSFIALSPILFLFFFLS